MFELSKQFRFEAAHTLHRAVDAEPSRRIHGHSYRAEVTVRGVADPETGMVVDLGVFERALDAARDGLDHRFLDDLSDLGPGTIENLSAWIWRKVEPACPDIVRVTVYRDSGGDTCTYFGPGNHLRG
ncbi:6-pyruvoyl trahydropterin synthase family protein [Pararoseomonas indoligenes]|uniref:6-carboxy-5,6,7,8-tetrahydropterin synthase n=1 Tax=Roseomonas indoligenes TaxID=2820811 RepID=A0A940N2Z0_9PROT|nr:6-carboxytetrahydropterin synthase [Pararoseomonas indoligenes]MBP0496268.1 6-carboxytetrahydropterin synthase [Pararoseomonas indoligenes]